jgi:hypothetical protein
MIACAKVESKATSGRFGLLGAIVGVVLYFGILLGAFWGLSPLSDSSGCAHEQAFRSLRT